jgi:hypothetical protein
MVLVIYLATPADVHWFIFDPNTPNIPANWPKNGITADGINLKRVHNEVSKLMDTCFVGRTVAWNRCDKCTTHIRQVEVEGRMQKEHSRFADGLCTLICLSFITYVTLMEEATSEGCGCTILGQVMDNCSKKRNTPICSDVIINTTTMVSMMYHAPTAAPSVWTYHLQLRVHQLPKYWAKMDDPDEDPPAKQTRVIWAAHWDGKPRYKANGLPVDITLQFDKVWVENQWVGGDTAIQNYRVAWFVVVDPNDYPNWWQHPVNGCKYKKRALTDHAPYAGNKKAKT